MMRRILIEAVSPADMRPPYDTQGGGDWQFNELGDLTIRVSRGSFDSRGFDNPDFFLVALHELVEAYLCKARGITQAAVDAFDKQWLSPNFDPDAEPGDDLDAPYCKEHRFACLIEFLMAHELGFSDYGTMR